MALIECPDCGKQVSDAAATCISCGRPLHGVAASPAPAGTREAPVLIEGSSKQYKRAMLQGIGLVPLGFVILLIGGAVNWWPVMTIGLCVSVAGVCWFIWNIGLRWYHHA